MKVEVAVSVRRLLTRLPRVKQGNTQAVEVPDVAGGESETVRLRRGGNERVHGPERETDLLPPRHDHTPGFGNARINVQDALFEPRRELLGKPSSQPFAPAPGRQH